MIVIDYNKKIRVHLQGKSSCHQHTKIFGHSFAGLNSVNVQSFIMIFACQEKVDLCTWHYEKKKKKKKKKKKRPHTFSILN